jgi:hypothetical protein
VLWDHNYYSPLVTNLNSIIKDVSDLFKNKFVWLLILLLQLFSRKNINYKCWKQIDQENIWSCAYEVRE